MDHAAVAGVGLTTTTSPHKQTRSKAELCREAVDAALVHAGVNRREIDAVVFGNIDGFEATNVSGKMVAPELGLAAGIPVYIINTGGTSGGNLVNVATTLIRGGEHQRVVCVGPNTFDGPLDLQAVINTASPAVMEQPLGMGAVHMGAFFPAAFQDATGATDEDFAAVTAKNRRNAVHNPYAHIRKPIEVSEVLESRPVSTPLDLAMVCPVSSGACALVVTTERIADTLPNPVVRIAACGSVSDTYLGGGRHDFSSFEVLTILADRIYREAQVGSPREDLDVLELFTPYSPMELMFYEDLGLCERGGAAELLFSGATEFGGDTPVNLSGGVQCTNPGVAAQLAPCGYLALQLMGQAVGGRQAENARRGLAHSTGGAFFQFHTLALMECP